MAIVLERSGEGYSVKGRESVQVRCRRGRTWNARLGSHASVTWYAYDTSAVDESAADWDCIRLADGTLARPFKRIGRNHSTLAALRAELARVLADL